MYLLQTILSLVTNMWWEEGKASDAHCHLVVTPNSLNEHTRKSMAA